MQVKLKEDCNGIPAGTIGKCSAAQFDESLKVDVRMCGIDFEIEGDKLEEVGNIGHAVSD